MPRGHGSVIELKVTEVGLAVAAPQVNSNLDVFEVYRQQHCGGEVQLRRSDAGKHFRLHRHSH